jgi:uncharacterized membrane protein YkvA (DUF1232 family)
MKQRLANLSRSELVILLLAVLYIISPADLVPELIAGPLGLTDDLAAAAVIGATLLRSRKPTTNSKTVVGSDPVTGPAAG